MKRLAIGFCLGVATVLGASIHLGPDAWVTYGTKWKAAQRTYIVTTQPVIDLDESMVAEALAYEAPKRKRK
jgi:hypothetical protein